MCASWPPPPQTRPSSCGTWTASRWTAHWQVCSPVTSPPSLRLTAVLVLVHLVQFQVLASARGPSGSAFTVLSRGTRAAPLTPNWTPPPRRPPALGVGLRVLSGCSLPSHRLLRLHSSALVSGCCCMPLLVEQHAWLQAQHAALFAAGQQTRMHPGCLDSFGKSPVRLSLSRPVTCRDLSTGDAIRIYSGHHKACVTCALNGEKAWPGVCVQPAVVAMCRLAQLPAPRTRRLKQLCLVAVLLQIARLMAGTMAN